MEKMTTNWQSLTTEEKNHWLAESVMGWTPNADCETWDNPNDSHDWMDWGDWTPLSDLNQMMKCVTVAVDFTTITGFNIKYIGELGWACRIIRLKDPIEDSIKFYNHNKSLNEAIGQALWEALNNGTGEG